VKYVTLEAEIVQNHVLFFDYSRGGFRAKAMICPIEGGFKVFVWEGDGKTSNIIAEVNPKIPTLDGFKLIHEGIIRTVLGCFIVVEAYFEKIGKNLTIHLFNICEQKREVEKLGLLEHFTDNGFFHVDKDIIKNSRSIPFISRCRIALSDLKERLTAKKTPPLTKEELAVFDEIIKNGL